MLIDYLRGRPAVGRVRALRATGDEPCTTAVNVEEIVRGLRASEQDAADTLLAGLVVLRVGEPEARLAGTWRRDFASTGTTLWQADCLVAATSLLAGARLATGNPKDFPMHDLAVETWPPGM